MLYFVAKARKIYAQNAFKPITKIDYEPRYEFAKYVIDPLKYVIDPLKYRFRKVIRVLGLVFLFISKLRKPKTSGKMCNPQTPNPDFLKYRGDRFVLTTGKSAQNSSLKFTGGLVVILPAEMTKLALSYYFIKATAEIFKFVDKKRYEKISVLKDGFFTLLGRVLSTQNFAGDANLCDAALDLTSSTFYMPLADNRSPIACALINEIHWHNFDAKHGGTEGKSNVYAT